MNNHSDYSQDLFAYLVNNKQPGFWVDIGARNFYGGGFGFNNTQFLYENGWTGLSMDIGNFGDSYKGLNGVIFKQVDVTQESLLRNAFIEANVPDVVDYLSHDIDEAGFSGLTTIDFSKYTFKCITIEHDSYHRGNSIRDKQRNFLQGLGYEILVSLDKYEDWYIHPKYVDKNRFTHFKEIESMIHPYPKEGQLNVKNILLHGIS